jgi:hypothetical protein
MTITRRIHRRRTQHRLNDRRGGVPVRPRADSLPRLRWL